MAHGMSCHSLIQGSIGCAGSRNVCCYEGGKTEQVYKPFGLGWLRASARDVFPVTQIARGNQPGWAIG